MEGLPNKYVLTLFALMSFTIVVDGQVSFSDQTMIYNPDLDIRSGSCGATADLNNDGLTDIVNIDRATHLIFGYNNGPGVPFTWVEGPRTSSSREYLCLVTDFENDGKPEILTSGSFSNTKIYKESDGGNFVFNQIIRADKLSQGGNTVDIDNNGFLDLFICSDEDDNLIAFNDQTGLLTIDTNFINWETKPISDNSGNYASEWVDVNGDHLLDLVIAKCRLGVNSLEDPRRINRLFIQQADGSFADEGQARGFDLGFQTWTTSMFDYDNDGDFDCLATHHDFRHILLENDGNGFFSQTDLLAGVEANFAFQSLVADFDNDGYEDIYIPGSAKDVLYMNQQGNGFFAFVNINGDPVNSAIMGDFNGDGFMDLNTFYSTGINFPGPQGDRIYINNTAPNNEYVNINLMGTESNLLGVGAEVRLYSNLGIQSRTIKSGESYGVSIRPLARFGLGENTAIDSLVILWPSGQKTIEWNIQRNKTLTFVEGQCVLPAYDLYTDTFIYCNQSIQLTGPDNQDVYIWSTGETGQSIFAGPGIYTLQTKNDTGCIAISNPIVIEDGNAAPPFIPTRQITKGCEGMGVEIITNAAEGSFVWSNGDTEAMTMYEESGYAIVTVTDQCGQESSDSVLIEIADPNTFAVKGDSVMLGGNAFLSASGSTITWYASESSDVPLLVGDTLLVFAPQENRDYYAQNEVILWNNIEEGGFDVEDADLFDPPVADHHYIVFDVLNDLNIQSFTVEASEKGRRIFTIDDQNGVRLYALEVDLNEGMQEVVFDAFLAQGQFYRLGTDTLQNIASFGSSSPRLKSNINSLSYPYIFDSGLQITTSSGSKALYPYFYNINVATNRVSCISDRKAVPVFIKEGVGVDWQDRLGISIQPNPVTDRLTIRSEVPLTTIQIYSLTGAPVLEKVLQRSSQTSQLDVTDLQSGVYTIVLSAQEQKTVKKFIKI